VSGGALNSTQSSFDTSHVPCRGENGAETEESREEIVGEIQHVYGGQLSAAAPAEAKQIHGSLLGL